MTASTTRAASGRLKVFKILNLNLSKKREHRLGGKHTVAGRAAPEMGIEEEAKRGAVWRQGRQAKTSCGVSGPSGTGTMCKLVTQGVSSYIR